MKATGIVRRLDDLGRIVIPKEIRRAMKVKEGDPLEIFGIENGICLKRYCPIDTQHWELAAKVAKTMLTHRFALLNQYGDVMYYNFKDKAIIDTFNYSKQIMVEGDCVGFIASSQEEIDCDKIAEVAKVLSTLFNED